MLNQLQREKFSRQFQQLDADGNGSLRWNDFEALLQRLAEARGWKPDSPSASKASKCYEELWQALIKHSDSDSDGSVSLAEWLNFHKTALYDSQVLLQINPAYEELVVTMTNFVQVTLDDDGDGEVTTAEYEAFCRAYGIETEEAKACFKCLDRNGDGKLTKAEILDLILEYYCSDEPSAPGNQFFGLFT